MLEYKYDILPLILLQHKQIHSMKKNFGAVMKAVMAKVGASAEGKKVSELIKGII